MAKKSRTPTPPRKVQAPQRRTESRKQPRTAEDRRTLYFAIAFAASGVAAIAIVVLVFTVLGGGGSSAIDQSKLVGLQTGPAPWNAGVDHLPDRLKPAGLNPLGAEGEVVHIHQHMDIYVNGKHITVPNGIGIYDGQFLTELHTHDATGLLHVESPKKRTFDLGQFFAAWGVRLDNDCIGGYCRPQTPWKIYVDGQEYTGDPGELQLQKHQEIAVVIGTPPKTIPSNYRFPAGT